MVVIEREGGRGVVLKDNIQDKNHVTVSSGTIFFNRVNCWLAHCKASKPYGDMTFNEMLDLIKKLKTM